MATYLEALRKAGLPGMIGIPPGIWNDWYPICKAISLKLKGSQFNRIFSVAVSHRYGVADLRA